jgi:hypothetical protein
MDLNATELLHKHSFSTFISLSPLGAVFATISEGNIEVWTVESNRPMWKQRGKPLDRSFQAMVRVCHGSGTGLGVPHCTRTRGHRTRETTGTVLHMYIYGVTLSTRC